MFNISRVNNRTKLFLAAEKTNFLCSAWSRFSLALFCDSIKQDMMVEQNTPLPIIARKSQTILQNVVVQSHAFTNTVAVAKKLKVRITTYFHRFKTNPPKSVFYIIPHISSQNNGFNCADFDFTHSQKQTSLATI